MESPVIWLDVTLVIDWSWRLDTQKILDAFKAVSLGKLCLHPEAPLACGGGLVHAHTIRKSGDLAKIAREGHVCVPANSVGDLMKPNRPAMKLMGIAKATTFNGFCNKHDTGVFFPIEGMPLKICQEHAFLLAYRSLCRELYAKLDLVSSMPVHREINEAKRVPSQTYDREFLNLIGEAAAIGLADLQEHKRMYDSVLTSKDYNQMNYFCIVFDKIPSVMCSGGFIPEIDFEGNALYQISDWFDLSKRMDYCSASCLALDDGGAMMFCWLGYSMPCERLIRSLRKSNWDRCPDRIINFIFEFFENIAVAPDWWDALATINAAKLIHRLQSGVDTGERSASSMLDDNSCVATFKVVDCRTNLTN